MKKPTPPPDDKVAVGPTTQAGNPDGIDPGITDKPGNGSGPVEAPAPPAIFRSVEQMPEFKGDVGKWLSEHVQYPEAAHENGITGKTIIQFVVNADGSVSGVEVVRSSNNSSLDAEAKRAVSSMPSWKPGKQNGKAVPVYYTLPITFTLE